MSKSMTNSITISQLASQIAEVKTLVEKVLMFLESEKKTKKPVKEIPPTERCEHIGRNGSQCPKKKKENGYCPTHKKDAENKTKITATNNSDAADLIAKLNSEKPQFTTKSDVNGNRVLVLLDEDGKKYLAHMDEKGGCIGEFKEFDGESMKPCDDLMALCHDKGILINEVKVCKKKDDLEKKHEVKKKDEKKDEKKKVDVNSKKEPSIEPEKKKTLGKKKDEKKDEEKKLVQKKKEEDVRRESSIKKSDNSEKKKLKEDEKEDEKKKLQKKKDEDAKRESSIKESDDSEKKEEEEEDDDEKEDEKEEDSSEEEEEEEDEPEAAFE